MLWSYACRTISIFQTYDLVIDSRCPHPTNGPLYKVSWNQSPWRVVSEHEETPYDKQLFFPISPNAAADADNSIIHESEAIMAMHYAFVVSSTPSPLCISLYCTRKQTPDYSLLRFFALLSPSSILLIDRSICFSSRLHTSHSNRVCHGFSSRSTLQ